MKRCSRWPRNPARRSARPPRGCSDATTDAGASGPRNSPAANAARARGFSGHRQARSRRPSPPARRAKQLIAFKMYFRLTPAQQRALHGWVELYLFPGGYAGLQLTENDEANLCLLVDRKAFAACNHRNGTELFAHLLRSCDPWPSASIPRSRCWPSRSRFRPSPTACSMDRAQQPGLWRLGDQAAVIPSFSGDGISIALHSAHLAAESLPARRPPRPNSRIASPRAAQLRGPGHRALAPDDCRAGSCACCASVAAAAAPLAQRIRAFPPPQWRPQSLTAGPACARTCRRFKLCSL